MLMHSEIYVFYISESIKLDHPSEVMKSLEKHLYTHESHWDMCNI